MRTIFATFPVLLTSIFSEGIVMLREQVTTLLLDCHDVAMDDTTTSTRVFCMGFLVVPSDGQKVLQL